MSILKTDWLPDFQEKRWGKIVAGEIIRARGIGKRPDPPRSLVAKPSTARATLTFEVAPGNPRVKARIYKDTESNLYAELPNGIRAIEIPGTTGTTMALYVSFCTDAGAESRKVAVRCTPT